jgi:hypothetical protein
MKKLKTLQFFQVLDLWMEGKALEIVNSLLSGISAD